MAVSHEAQRVTTPYSRGSRAQPIWRAEVVVIAVAVLGGLVLGLLLGVLRPTQYRAVALVDAGPGATVADSLAVGTDSSNRFVQTELIFIGIEDPQIRSVISARLSIENPPSVVSRQVGNTNVVELAMVGFSPQTASDMANIASAVYIRDWKNRATADLQRGLSETRARLGEIRTELSRLPEAGGTPTQSGQRAALTAELTKLTRQQADLTVQRNTIEAAQRVVAEADPELATRTSSTVTLLAMGGLLGGLVGVGVVLIRRRWNAMSRDDWAA